MAEIQIDPILPKPEFARARGVSTRTLDRWVKMKRLPRGEPINDTALGWRASLVNMRLDELEALAKAQSDAERPSRSDEMRELGAKGGRMLKRGRPTKAQPAPEAA